MADVMNQGRGMADVARSAASLLYPGISQRALRLSVALRARAGSETAPGPAVVTLELNHGGQPAAAAGLLDRFFRARRTPSCGEWLSVVSSMPVGSTLRLSGAEPLESPHLEMLLFEADRRGLDVEILTAGASLEERAPIIYGLGVARLRLFLYGLEASHNAALGSPTAFERTVRGALAIAGLRYGTSKPVLHAHIVTRADNHQEIGDAVECAFAMGCDGVTVNLPVGIDAGAAALLAGQLRRLSARWPAAVGAFPSLSGEAALRYCRGGAEAVGPKRCRIPWYSLAIGADGSAWFCGDEPLGNITTHSLADLYNSAPARELRRKLRNGLLPKCSNCVGRFGDEGLRR